MKKIIFSFLFTLIAAASFGQSTKAVVRGDTASNKFVATKTDLGKQQVADYVITKSGSTITATARKGSGLNDYSGTDAATVIKNAIVAGNSVFIGDGNYTIAASIASTATRDGLTITASPKAKLIATANLAQSGTWGILRLENVSNLKITGLTIQGNFSIASPAITTNGVDISNIYLAGCSNVVVEKCYLTEAVMAGVLTSNCSNVIIQNNTIPTTPGYALRCTNTPFLRILNNYTSGRGTAQHDTTLVGQTPGIMVTTSDNVLIDGNTIEDFKNTGTKTEGCSYVTYSSNVVRNSGKDGIKVQGYNTTRVKKAIVANNHVEYLRPWSSQGSGLIIVADCDEFIIEGNVVSGGVRGTTMGIAETGISVNGSNVTPALVKGGVIKGNTIKNVGDDGIYLEDAQDIVVEGNYILDYAIDRADRHGINIYSGSRVRVLSNNIERTTRAASGFGYGISAIGASHELSGNKITNPTEGAISYDVSTCPVVRINNNTILFPTANINGTHGIIIKATAAAVVDIISVDGNTVSGGNQYFFYISRNNLTANLITFRNNGLHYSAAFSNRYMIEGFGTGTIGKIDVTGSSTVGPFNAAEFSIAGAAFALQTGKDSYQGTGTPEGVLAARVGSTFIRTDGGTSTTLYVKETGTGNTGWKAK